MASLTAIRSILNKFTGRSAVGVDISRHFATMVKTKKFIYAKRFNGEPKETDFQLVEEELPPLKDGGRSLCFCVVNGTKLHNMRPWVNRKIVQRKSIRVTFTSVLFNELRCNGEFSIVFSCFHFEKD